VHVVAKGQTLGRIAKRYRTSVEALREVNNLRPGDRLHPGLSLVIPEKGREGEAAKKAAQLQLNVDARDGRDHSKKGKAEKTPPRGKKGGVKAKRDDADDKGEPAPAFKGPKRRGFVRLTRGPEKLEVQLVNRRGHLTPPALASLGRILRFYPTGAATPIDPRLAALVGEVSDHFTGRPIRVVSGFRPYTPAQYTPHSNHNVGRAMDFSIEGVPNMVVRDFCPTAHSFTWMFGQERRIGLIIRIPARHLTTTPLPRNIRQTSRKATWSLMRAPAMRLRPLRRRIQGRKIPLRRSPKTREPQRKRGCLGFRGPSWRQP